MPAAYHQQRQQGHQAAAAARQRLRQHRGGRKLGFLAAGGRGRRGERFDDVLGGFAVQAGQPAESIEGNLIHHG